LRQDARRYRYDDSGATSLHAAAARRLYPLADAARDVRSGHAESIAIVTGLVRSVLGHATRTLRRSEAGDKKHIDHAEQRFHDHLEDHGDRQQRDGPAETSFREIVMRAAIASHTARVDA